MGRSVGAYSRKCSRACPTLGGVLLVEGKAFRARRLQRDFWSKLIFASCVWCFDRAYYGGGLEEAVRTSSCVAAAWVLPLLFVIAERRSRSG